LDITTINLKDPYYFKPWQALLKNEGLFVENIEDITETIGIFDEEELIATGSYNENVNSSK